MRKVTLGVLLLTLLSCGLLTAVVVRPAANIPWVDANGKLHNSAEFRGKAVVLLIAPTPRDRRFRGQVGQLHKIYERFAAQKVIFMAAFTQEAGRIKSNIPFVISADGPRTGYDYNSTDRFAIAVIGRDGNLDYVTNKVLPAQRIYDVIQNSFTVQEQMRRP